MSLQPLYLRLKKIRLKDPSLKKILFKADSILIKPHLKSILERRLVISRIKIERPYMVIEILHNKKIITPFTKFRSKRKKKKKKKGFEIYIKRIRLVNGKISFVDRRAVNRSHRIQFKKLNAEIENILLPRSNLKSRIDIKGFISGKRRDGSFRSSGWINLDNKDTDTRISIRNLEVRLLEPYYKKKAEVGIESGLLNANSHIVIKDAKLNAPGMIRLRELEIKPDSNNRTFLGIPSYNLLMFLKDNNGAIDLKFNIEGDIENPRFSIKDSLLSKLGESISRELGDPVRTAKKVLKKTGKKGAEVLKGLKSVGEKVGGFLKRLISP